MERRFDTFQGQQEFSEEEQRALAEPAHEEALGLQEFAARIENGRPTEQTADIASAIEKREVSQITELAQQYVNLPRERFEEGIAAIEKALAKLHGGYPAHEFLRGMLDLEMYNALQGNEKRVEEAQMFFDGAAENFRRATESERACDITYATQDAEGNKKEVVFGSRSLGLAYRGDLSLKRRFKENDLAHEEESDRLYREAIRLEHNIGLAHELKGIFSIRKITNALGNYGSVKCWKTTRREDLRWEAADMLLEYHDDQKKRCVSRYIDITTNMSEAKEKKQRYGGETYVMGVPKTLLDFITECDLKSLSKTTKEAGHSRVEALQAKNAFLKFLTLSSQLERALSLKNIEKEAFRKNFWLNKSRFAQLFPFVNEEHMNALALVEPREM